MTPEQAQSVLNFMDRVPVTGHQERLVMNDAVEALVAIRTPVTPPTLVEVPKDSDGETDPE